MTRLTRIAAAIAFGAAALGIAACGGTKEEAKATPAAAAKAATATTVATQAAPKPLTITGADYAFTVDGQAAPGIQTITFKNAGKEDHELQLVSLEQGKTIVDAQKVLATPGAAIPDWVKFNGGAWAIPAGGQSAMTAKLNAGPYILLCFVQSPDGASHVAKGMVGVLDVKGAESKDAAPTATLAIEASDYAFKLPADAAAGKATISLKNTGKETHLAGLIRVPDGVAYEAFTKALLAPAPAAAATPAAAASPKPSTTGTPAAATTTPAASSGVSGGVGALSAGGQAWSTVDLKAGVYAVVCLVPDTKGVPYAARGMINKLTVK